MGGAKEPEKIRGSTRNVFARFFLKLAGIAAVLYLAVTFVIGVFRMNGNNMFPAVRDGDLCITYRLEEYHTGDIVAYRRDQELQFARIVACAGDTVDWDENGCLINGAYPLEEVTYQTDMSSAAQWLPLTLAEGEVFLLNDFRMDTKDSRSFGAVSVKDLEGKLIALFRRRGF